MRAIRTAIVLAALTALTAGALYGLRLPLAGMAVRAGMSAAGLENPRAQVTALAFDKIDLANISAGVQGRALFIIEVADIRFDWRDALTRRRVDSVMLGPGEVRLRLPPDGGLAPLGFSPGADGVGALPFSALTLEDIALAVDTPEGSVSGAVSGHYHADRGGAAALDLRAARAGRETLVLENAALNVSAEFSDDGTASFKGDFTGDMITPQGRFYGVRVAIDGAGKSWKDVAAGEAAAFSGEASLALLSGTAPVADIPALAQFGAAGPAMIFGGPVSELNASGRMKLALGEDGVSAFLEDGAPLSLAADGGAALQVEALDEGALFRWGRTGAKAAFAYTLRGALVSLTGAVNAETNEEGWYVLAPIRVGAYRTEAASIDDASAMIRLETRPDGFSADITTSAMLEQLSIGRLKILDTPLSASFLVDVDMAERRASASLAHESCAELARGRFLLEQGDIDIALSDAAICAAPETPFARLDWDGDFRAEVAGLLTARRGAFAIANARLAGTPPQIEFAGAYRPSMSQTLARGSAGGGAMLLNDALLLSHAEAQFEFALDTDNIEITSQIARLRIAQNEQTPLLAPFEGSGSMRLFDSDATFDYVVNILDGARLGAGAGSYDLARGSGETRFVLDPFEFRPEGVQPSQLAPVLKGVIAKAQGAIAGAANIAWDSSGVRSSAEIVLDDVSFAGPTRVVTRTSGVNADLRFSNLWPVASQGTQTVKVAHVDLGALQLEQGEIRFALPGDETLRIEFAEFPWFGGKLGLYDARASLAGDRVTAPLRAENIDLAQILDFANVNGLSGEGLLGGVLPLVVENGRARIENGVLRSQSPGVLHYVGGAAAAAASASGQAKLAFDLLRDFRFDSLAADIDGPLDGHMLISVRLEGAGEAASESLLNVAGLRGGGGASRGESVKIPTIYNINLDADWLSLFNQINLSRDIELQIERALGGEE